MTLLERAGAIADNRVSGAAALLEPLLPLLAEALAAGEETTRAVVRRVCEGQPAMAALWNACAAAIADRERPGRFARVRAEMERAPAALARVAGDALNEAVRDESAPVVVTVSHSASVAAALAALDHRGLRIVCGEGRPRFEGRTLAQQLAAGGHAVTVTTDAALTTFLTEATVVVSGADALAADCWINKVGTLGLCAAAARSGVPVYVVASRDKAMAEALHAQWHPVIGPPDEVWPSPPEGVAPVNPYFEAISADLATLFLTDAGALTPGDLPMVTTRFAEDIRVLLAAELLS